MPYYISPFVATSRYRPHHITGAPATIPRGVDPDNPAHNWIQRTHPTLGDFAFVWTDDPISGIGVIEFSNDGDERLGLVSRTALANRFDDRPFRATATWRETLVDLLRNPPTDRLTLEGVLRPSKARSRYEVWLGPGGRGNNLFHSESAPPSPNSKTFLDSFNRADGNLNASSFSDGSGCTWTEIDGTLFAIVGNQCVATNITSGSFLTAQGSSALDTDDHYAQIECVTYTRAASSALNWGVLTRMPSASSSTGYGAEVGTTTGGTSSGRLFNQNTDATLATYGTILTSGTLRLESDESSHTVEHNSSTIIGPVTNTAITGNFRGGILAWSFVGNTNDLAYESFEEGDIVAAAGGVASRLTYLGVG